MKYSTDFSHAGLFRPRLLEEGGGGIRMQRVLSVTRVSAEARGRVVWFVHAQGLLDLSKHSSSSFAAGWFSLPDLPTSFFYIMRGTKAFWDLEDAPLSKVKKSQLSPRKLESGG